MSVELKYLAQYGSSTPRELFTEQLDKEKEILKGLKSTLK
jgi:hypothetical protein